MYIFRLGTGIDGSDQTLSTKRLLYDNEDPIFRNCFA